MRRLAAGFFVAFALAAQGAEPESGSGATVSYDVPATCAGTLLDEAAKAAVLDRVQRGLWSRFHELKLLTPILQQSTSAGVPQRFRDLGLTQDDATFAQYFPETRLYLEFRVPKKPGEAPFLEMGVRFHSVGLGINSPYLKTMLSYAMASDGRRANAEWARAAARGLPSPVLAQLKDLVGPVRWGAAQDDVTAARENASIVWNTVTAAIWSGVSREDRYAALRILAPTVTRLFPDVAVTPDDDRWAVSQRVGQHFFLRAMPLIEREALVVGYVGETASLRFSLPEEAP